MVFAWKERLWKPGGSTKLLYSLQAKLTLISKKFNYSFW